MNSGDMGPRLLPGTECIIEGLVEDATVSQRLSEMGVLPGSRLRVLRVSPLGGTLEVQVDDSETLALRQSDLERLRCRFTALPLTRAAGRFPRELRIRALLGGRGFHERMQRRQLLPGQALRVQEATPHRIRVVPGDAAGPVELGAGEAVKIIVEPLAAAAAPEQTP